MDSQKVIYENLKKKHLHSFLPPLGSGGNDFCVISQTGGQLLNFKSQGGDTFMGEDDFRQSSRGGTALS